MHHEVCDTVGGNVSAWSVPKPDVSQTATALTTSHDLELVHDHNPDLFSRDHYSIPGKHFKAWSQSYFFMPEA